VAILITVPAGGERYEVGDPVTLVWTDPTGIEWDVLLYKNGAYDSDIILNHASKSYNWTVPSKATAADYEIYVINDVAESNLSAQFTIATLTTRSISDPTAAITDSVSNTYNWLRSLSESFDPVTDAIVRIYNWVKTLLDYVVPGDSMIVKYITTAYNHMVYHVDFDAWTQFSYIDELRACVLTGGSLTENINLILTNANTVNKYPGDDITSLDSVLKTRRYDMRMGILRRLWLDFTGSATVQTRVYNDAYGSPYYKENTIGTYLRKVWRGIAGGYNRGDSFELLITNADIIKNAVVDVSIIGKG